MVVSFEYGILHLKYNAFNVNVIYLKKIYLKKAYLSPKIFNNLQ